MKTFVVDRVVCKPTQLKENAALVIFAWYTGDDGNSRKVGQFLIPYPAEKNKDGDWQLLAPIEEIRLDVATLPWRAAPHYLEVYDPKDVANPTARPEFRVQFTSEQVDELTTLLSRYATFVSVSEVGS